MFLDDGVNDVQEQMAREEKKKRQMLEKGYVKLRVLDTSNGNRFVTKFIKKDEATEMYEAELAKNQEIKNRELDIERRHKAVQMMEKEKELEAKLKELEAYEKKLMEGKNKEKEADAKSK